MPTKSLKRLEKVKTRVDLVCISIVFLIQKSRKNFDVIKNVTVLTMTVLLLLTSTGLRAETEVGFTRLGDATHLEFSGETEWNYQINRKGSSEKNLLEMKLPSLSLSAIEKLKNWKDALVEKVEVVKTNEANRQYKILFTLKDHKINSFDYLTESPSRLVIDFYLSDEEQIKPEEKVSKAVEGKSIKTVGDKNLPKKNIVSRNLKVVRKPAGTDYISVKSDLPEGEGAEEFSGDREFMRGIFDGADEETSRFSIKDYQIDQKAINASKQDIYLKFPPLNLGNRGLRDTLAQKPEYEIIEKDTEENKVARLLLVLFKKNKIAMFTKTLKYFRSKYPESVYNEIVGYAEADLHYNWWTKDGEPAEFEIAIGKYSELLVKYPKSLLAPRTYKLIGYSYLKKKDPYGALKSFQKFKQSEIGKGYASESELAIAEALLVLNKFEDAIALYNKISKKYQGSSAAIEAAYLKGDAYFLNKNYKKAVKNYQNAVKKYPKEWKEYPNAFFNLAESFFWLGKYKKSLNAEIDFLKRFPSNAFGGLAMTRIGELLEVLRGPNKNSMGAYLESYFRYKASQGADLARVRIISHRMKKMKRKSLESSLAELDKIIERSEINGMAEFVTVKTSDGYYDRKEFDNSTKTLVNFYQKNPTRIKRDVFERRIVRNIASKIGKSLNDKKPIDALSEYYKEEKKWLKFSDRLDIKYNLALAYEKTGVHQEAEKIYKDVVNKLYSIKVAKKNLERDAFEQLPSIDKVNLRLAAVTLKKKAFVDANNYLKEIKSTKDLLPKEKVEMVEIAASIAEERGRSGLAKSFFKKLVKTWKGQPELVSVPYVKLAELQEKNGDFQKAEVSLQRVIDMQEDTGNIEPLVYFNSLKKLADLALKKNKIEKAIKTYSRILKEFEDTAGENVTTKKSMSALRYKVGKLQFDQGEIKEAEKTWSPLKKGKLWEKIANENLQSQKWESKYKKYINRIPAMSKVKDRLRDKEEL